MADMMIEYELSKSLLYMTAMKLDAGSPDVPRAVAALKAQLGKSGRFVGQQAIQIHGGMGMTDELPVSHFFKRMTMIDLSFGNRDHHLERLVAMGA
jgi:alkylation response protein AidB-like acyl-CoA dehydrogenase